MQSYRGERGGGVSKRLIHDYGGGGGGVGLKTT